MTAVLPDFGALKEQISRKKEKFDLFFRLLTEYNGRYNLTAVTEERDVFYKHFLDSLAGETYFPRGAKALEVGSGAGFPSIPLMIVREDLHFALVESTGKKCEFLKIAAEKLALDAAVFNARAEDLAKDPAHREKYDVCCARAVARLNTLAEYCMPFVRRGGVFLAYKGDAEEEISEARRAFSVLGGEETSVRYELPENYGTRTLVAVKKTARTPEKYPRGQGREKKCPL